MRALVTGGAGFIGSHLVERLLNEGSEVIVLDNLSAGKREWVDRRAKMLAGDIRDPTTVATAMQGCGAVFHLAAITDARSSDEDAIYQVNYLGSENVFRIAKSKGCRIIFTSSAAVYGEKSGNEETKCNPINQYGKSKLKAETLLRRAGPDFFAVRIFNCYGPRSKSVVNRFCEKIPDYKDITVYGSGMQTRDFVHVSDVVSALMLGLEKSGLYNLGTGVETSLIHLIDMVHNITKSKPSVKFTPPVEGDIKRSKAEITRLKSAGWAPKISLEDGVRSLLSEMGWKPAGM